MLKSHGQIHVCLALFSLYLTTKHTHTHRDTRTHTHTQRKKIVESWHVMTCMNSSGFMNGEYQWQFIDFHGCHYKDFPKQKSHHHALQGASRFCAPGLCCCGAPQLSAPPGGPAKWPWWKAWTWWLGQQEHGEFTQNAGISLGMWWNMMINFNIMDTSGKLIRNTDGIQLWMSYSLHKAIYFWHLLTIVG